MRRPPNYPICVSVIPQLARIPRFQRVPDPGRQHPRTPAGWRRLQDGRRYVADSPRASLRRIGQECQPRCRSELVPQVHPHAESQRLFAARGALVLAIEGEAIRFKRFISSRVRHRLLAAFRTEHRQLPHVAGEDLATPLAEARVIVRRIAVDHPMADDDVPAAVAAFAGCDDGLSHVVSPYGASSVSPAVGSGLGGGGGASRASRTSV